MNTIKLYRPAILHTTISYSTITKWKKYKDYKVRTFSKLDYNEHLEQLVGTYVKMTSN